MTTTERTRMPFRTPNFPWLSAIALGLLCFIAQTCLLVSTALSSSRDDLSKAVDELLAASNPNHYDVAERRVAELLKQFTDPKDQAKIWFELTEIYYNSAGPPERIAECAKKTLELPIEPEKRVRLYEVWGDAEARVGYANVKNLAVHRKAAALLRLQGVAEFRKLDLTAAPPNPPPLGAGRPAPSLSLDDRLALLKAERQNADRMGFVTGCRDACLACIAYDYRLFPYAPDGEIRAIVMEKLNDPKLADELVRSVDRAIAADAKATQMYMKVVGSGVQEPDGPLAKHDLPPPSDRGRLVLVLSSFLLLLTVVLVARRWRSSNRDGQT